MKRIHLSEWILVIFLLGALLFGVNKCSEKKEVEQEYDELWTERSELIKVLNVKSQENDSLLANIDNLQSSIETEKHLRRDIEASYERDRTILMSIPPQELLDSLTGLLEGDVYNIDSSGIYDFGLTKLNLKECEDLTESLEKESLMLMRAIDGYSMVSNNLTEDLDDCTSARIDLEKDLKKEELEKKKFKGKVWSTRAVGGILGVVLLVALL
jgi:hypothetical protein